MAFQIRGCEWCEAEVAFFQSKHGTGNGKPGDYRPLMDVSGKVAKKLE